MGLFQKLSISFLLAFVVFQIASSLPLEVTTVCSSVCGGNASIPCCPPDHCCFRESQMSCCPCFKTFLCSDNQHLCDSGAKCSEDNLVCEKDGIRTISYLKI